jgi:hypothetical protein
MKQVILCIGCGVQVGCNTTEHSVTFCNECNRAEYCYIRNGDGVCTESFITCERCQKRFENFEE